MKKIYYILNLLLLPIMIMGIILLYMYAGLTLMYEKFEIKKRDRHKARLKKKIDTLRAGLALRGWVETENSREGDREYHKINICKRTL